MSETIFLLNNNGQLVEMNEAGYLSEDMLQTLIANYPALISGSQIDPESPRRWLLISREFGVPDDKESSNRWSLDHLFIDQDGIPTLVEVKRSTDTRIRREVIGQILDYAANAVTYWSIQEIKRQFEESCKSLDRDPDLTLAEFLQGESEIDDFWETAKTNLKAGKIRLLIIADTIPRELQRIIEFLNEQMTPAEILGLEIKQFTGQDLKTLVPRVIGMTSDAQIVKGRQSASGEQWDEDKFFKELLNQRGQEETAVARKILDWIRPRMTHFWYGTGKQGSVAPYVKDGKTNRFCFAIFTYGTIEIYFQHMKGRPVFGQEAKRLELLNKLNTIKNVAIPTSRISARPTIALSQLADKQELQKFLDAFDWYWREQGL